jgi:hypothetical protein
MTSANQNAYNFNPRLRDAANAPALAWLADEMEFDARHRARGTCTRPGCTHEGYACVVVTPAMLEGWV